MKHRLSLSTLLLLLVIHGAAPADTFTYLDEDGKTVTVDAKLVGEGQGAFALELPGGELRLIPQGAVQERKPAEDPTPLSAKEALEQLREKFGDDKFRGLAEGPYALGLILSEPLPKQYETRAASMLKKAHKFFKTVEGVFLSFMKDVKVPVEAPRYPLVVLIFETDDDFEEFTHADTEGRGLSAGNIAGYYNMLSNQLVIRMSECHTFDTPLHEAIHQQAYNRGVLQRMAQLPAWFNEGLATGFEGNGEKIAIGPMKVSQRYSRQAMRARSVNWDDVVADDTAFRGDVLAGEAYGHAWSIHWLLASRHKKEYAKYLELLGEKRALERYDAAARRQDFEASFGKSVNDLQQEFSTALATTARKQNIDLTEPKTPGYSLTTTNLADVEMTAVRMVDQGNRLEVEGQLRNLSQLRPMVFYVTVETDSGTYADWYVTQLAPQKVAPLSKQVVQKVMENAPGGPSQSFRVRVKAAVPDSDTGQNWQRGQLPKPKYRPG